LTILAVAIVSSYLPAHRAAGFDLSHTCAPNDLRLYDALAALESTKRRRS